MHDLPLMALNEYVGREVGGTMGIVKKVNLDYEKEEWGEFMRIRVWLDITKSLLRSKELNLELFELVSVSLSYERLPDLYYCCRGVGT